MSKFSDWLNRLPLWPMTPIAKPPAMPKLMDGFVHVEGHNEATLPNTPYPLGATILHQSPYVRVTLFTSGIIVLDVTNHGRRMVLSVLDGDLSEEAE